MTPSACDRCGGRLTGDVATLLVGGVSQQSIRCVFLCPLCWKSFEASLEHYHAGKALAESCRRVGASRRSPSDTCKGCGKSPRSASGCEA
jgi:hypothetical protein